MGKYLKQEDKKLVSTSEKKSEKSFLILILKFKRYYLVCALIFYYLSLLFSLYSLSLWKKIDTVADEQKTEPPASVILFKSLDLK